MIKSMTGYGSAKGSVEGLQLTVELKSVYSFRLWDGSCSGITRGDLGFRKFTVAATVVRLGSGQVREEGSRCVYSCVA